MRSFCRRSTKGSQKAGRLSRVLLREADMMDALYDDPALAGFYDWDNPWTSDFDWFLSLVEGARSVLDLGCGTGIFSAALAARGAEVVGVDPAGPMLAIARARKGGERVTWVQADAREWESWGREASHVVEAYPEHGLVERWAGDPRGGPLWPGCPDFIPIGRAAP